MAELVCRSQDHEQWLTARRAGVTATDVVTLAGLASWDSPFALYWRKKGLLPEVTQSSRMRLGLWLEAQIGQEWQNAHPADTWELGGLYRSSERTWQLATPDYLIGCDPGNHCGGHAVLEVKTASSRDGWGADGTDQVPARVRAQVLWQMDVMGVAVGHVAVCFLPSGEIRSYTVAPDEEWRDALRHLGATFFWQLEQDDPPPVDGLPATTEALKHLHAAYQPKTTAEITMPIAGRYIAACDFMRELETEKREMENKIREQLGDAALAVCDGQVIARREVYKRREYTVPAGTVDRLVRVKPKETSDVQ